MNTYDSEIDFENSIPSPASFEPAAIDKKHAYKKVVLTTPSKPEASPSERLSPIVSSEKNLDKINNLAQKEISLSRVGVTREKAYRVIAQALDAKKWMDVVDRQGNVKQEWVDDIEKQRWGCEMAVKMFGDMIERKEIEHDVSDRTLDRLRSLSVAELKAKAADILLGKRVSVVEAEVVRG